MPIHCRFTRSLKQEEVYRRTYETVAEAGKGIADYLRYFNEERPHQGLDNRTPETYSTNENRCPKRHKPNTTGHLRDCPTFTSLCSAQGISLTKNVAIMTFIKISITVLISGAYIVMPIDALPDVIPVVGGIDDASVGSLASIISYWIGKKANIKKNMKRIENALEDVAEAMEDLEDDVEDVIRKLD